MKAIAAALTAFAVVVGLVAPMGPATNATALALSALQFDETERHDP